MLKETEGRLLNKKVKQGGGTVFECSHVPTIAFFSEDETRKKFDSTETRQEKN